MVELETLFKFFFSCWQCSERMWLNRWREIGRRLRRMERAELCDRLRQESAQRQDAALAWIGYDFACASRTRAQAPGKAGNFFFAQDSIDSILDLLRQRLPGQAEQIVRQADQICQHRFDLLGYAGLDYGWPIDWHIDAVHGKKAPQKAFHKIHYLTYAEVGDSKVTWELNRHQHLVTLAKAYRLTGDRRFADETLRQWRHWQAENPYPVGNQLGQQPGSSVPQPVVDLDVSSSARISPGCPTSATSGCAGLALHGRHIERYLSTYFSPNTHLLGEGVGLFFLGVLCPELSGGRALEVSGLEDYLAGGRSGRFAATDSISSSRRTTTCTRLISFCTRPYSPG